MLHEVIEPKETFPVPSALICCQKNNVVSQHLCLSILLSLYMYMLQQKITKIKKGGPSTPVQNKNFYFILKFMLFRMSMEENA